MRDPLLQRWLSLAAISLCAAGPAMAQTITGSINGTITDEAGAVVANATVIAKNVATGVETRTVTNGTGTYNLRFLQIGQYTVTVQQPGFTAQRLGPIALEVDQAAKLNVKLAVGGDTTTVKVNSELQPILDADNSTVATTFTSRTIENLPLNGRNFSSVTQFVPGAVATSPQGFTGQNGIERNTNQSGQVSVNGNRNQSNNYLLDGIEINEPINNTIGYNPAPESIGELQVITSNADAEYGNANGGAILVVTKSGTNRFHGGAYGYLENQNLDANSWKNNFSGVPRQPFNQTVFGGTLGGPIKRDKLFFFVDYEGARSHQGGNESASVFTAAQRQGDFSSLLTPTVSNPHGIQLYHFVPGQGQVAYARDQVPVTNPAAQYLFAHPELYPLPNNPAGDVTGVLNNYQGRFRQTIRNDQADAKVDYTLSPRDTFFVRYSQSDANDAQPLAPLLITFPTNNDYPFKGVAINYVHTFSPSIVNEARAGWSRVRFIQGTPTDPTGAFGLNGNSLLGIGAGQVYPGFTALNFSASPSPGASAPTSLGNSAVSTNFIDNIFLYEDNLTIVRGAQTFKLGAEVERYQQNAFYPGNDGALGTFNYSGVYTAGPAGTAGAPGYGAADFVSNEAVTANVGAVGGRTGQRQYRDAGFVQDDWKVRPNFTANLGLRYEYDQPIYEVNNRQANVDLATGQVYLAGSAGAAAVFGDNRALYHPVYSQFVPRIGFSWQPKQRIVFRGGYGITNYFEGTGLNLRLNFNPPFENSFENTALSPTATSGGTPYQVQGGFGAGNAAPNIYRAWDSNIRPAFIQEFTFSNEIQLDNQTSVSLAYLGQLGQHLIDARAANQIRQGTTVAPYAGLVGQNGSIVETQSDSVSKYNALQIQVRHRQHNGLEYTVNYTWSHALTNSSGFFGVASVNGSSPYWQDAYNGHADYGDAGFDVRNNLSGTLVYQLPFGRGQEFGGHLNRYVDEAVGGWKISGDATVYSGLPVTIFGPNNTNLFNRAERANQYRPLIVQNRSIAHWFGTGPTAQPCQTLGTQQDNPQCAYGAAGLGQFGSAQNNSQRAPGFEQIDVTAAKSFAITEQQHVEFRGDFFNVGNIASYSNPDNNIQDSTFGQITDVRSIPRTVQLSLHYSF